MCSAADDPTQYDDPTRYDESLPFPPLPPGYSLEIHPHRKFKYRSLWDVRIYKDGVRLWGRAYYNVPAGIREAQRWAWAAVDE